jgi:protein TonB
VIQNRKSIANHDSRITNRRTVPREIVRAAPKNFNVPNSRMWKESSDRGRFHTLSSWRPPCTTRRPEGAMFDLITGQTTHIPNKPAFPIVLTSIAEALVLSIAVILPVLIVTDHVPEIPTMMAFVAAPPAPPPPPPPPPPAAAKTATPPEAKAVPTVGENAAPLEAPSRIEPEAPAAVDEGVPGGVEGGVPGGVVAGIVGGLPTDVPPPPPPPPPPPERRGPVHIGGQLQAPALVRRVEPVYPPFAVRAGLTGVVIIEATVDKEGQVVSATILRSAGPLLDKEALVAVKQWRYAPLLLNGKPEAFILSVTLSFNIMTQPTGE